MTLAELLVAMLVAGLVTLAVGHVTVQMTSGASRIDQRSQAQTETALAMVRMRTELEQATTLVSLTARTVTFRHPDVTGDGQRDVVSYEWSGTAGDPLTREVNSGGKETVLQQCRGLTLAGVVPPIHLVAGTRYPLKLEYFESTGSASCRLMWSAAGVTKQVVPKSCLYPAYYEPSSAPGLSGIGLTGQYYDNADLTKLVLSRTDDTVDKSWGTAGPGGGIDADTFSVRWTGQVSPAVTGDYTFYVTSDDGVRLWVDNWLVIDNWILRTAAESSGSSTGVSRINIRLEAGTNVNPVQLDGAVRLVNRPGVGG